MLTFCHDPRSGCGATVSIKKKPWRILPGQNESHSNPNQRICQQCSHKKTRCDKIQPCINCSKSQLECNFLGPGRAPRRKKRPLKAELISRLKRLEDEVKGLMESIEEANRVNRFSCSQNAVVSEVNGTSEQRGKLIVGE